MAKGNFAACLQHILKYEGGYVDHPADPGGATNMGITRRTLAQWRKISPWKNLPKSEVKNLHVTEVSRIYSSRYWSPVKGDLLPYGVDLAVFGFGVNSGVSRSSKYLQRVVGAVPDGRIGAETLKAVAAMNGGAIIKKLCAKRLSFVQGLSTWKTFGRGWARRIADVEVTSFDMWVRAQGRDPAIHTDLDIEVKTAKNSAKHQNNGAATVGAGGGGTVGLDMFSDQVGGWMVWAVVAIVVITMIALLMKSRNNKIRAKAYQDHIEALTDNEAAG